MQDTYSSCAQSCPDCGHALQTLWDYPSNEVWCLHCGNRFYQTISPFQSTESLAGFSLMILETSTDRREELARHFSHLGYQVTPVCHPRQALEAASFRRFDIAVLGANWPSVDTVALVERLRQQMPDMKFVIYFHSEGGFLPGELLSPEVLCVRSNMHDMSDLELALEHMVDELVGARHYLTSDATSQPPAAAR